MNTVVYLVRHAETIDEKGIRNTNETDQMINEKEILSIKGEKDSKALSENNELKNIDNLPNLGKMLIKDGINSTETKRIFKVI